MIFMIFITLSLLAEISLAIRFPLILNPLHGQKDTFQYGNASSTLYDASIEMCCNGKIHNRPYDDYVSCCKTEPFELYDPGLQICVDGRAVPKDSTYCNNIKYDPNTENCCLNSDRSHFRKQLTVVPKSDTKKILFCCGNKIITDKKNEICCGSTVFPRGSRCCGPDKIYNNTQLCCESSTGNMVLEKQNEGDDACCSDKPYNSNSFFCCDGNLVESSPGTKCCSGIVYNETESICCEGTVRPIESGVCCVGMWSEKFHSVPNGKCCELEVLTEADIGTAKEFCCNREKFNNIDFEYRNDSVACCGRSVFDVETHECCGLTLVPINADGRSSCCLYTEDTRDFIDRNKF